jgi:non-ribosomal peptide synthase protein (TIGR01720 family)
VKLSAEETEALLREVPKAHQTQINEVLLTALLQSCGRWSGESHLLVDLEGHGREEISEELDLSRTVGWFTTITPVLLEQPAGATGIETLAAVKEQLRQMPQRGIGYGLLRYLSEDKQLRAQPKPDLSFNYIGQVDQSFNESALLKATREPIGPIADPATPLPHKIYVNGIVFEGQLLMRFKYSDNLYRSATIEKLADNFITDLRSLIDQCRSSVARRHRVTDFPLLKVDQEMLDQAFAQISFTGMSGQASYENIADAYPLSPAQEGILFHSLYEHGTGAYVVQISCTFHGLNVSAVEQAWQRVVERHPILRSAFVWGELDKPLQVVGNRVELRFDKQDWRDRSTHEQDEQLQAYLAADRSRGFESSEAPLMRFALLQIQDDAYHFVWSHHHLLLDGWSIFMVLKEVFEYYEAFNQGRELEIPAIATYRDYLAWLQEHDLSGAKEFWQRTLKGFTTPNELRMDGTPDAEVGYSEQIVELPATLTAELQSLARQHHLTLNTLVQGAWSLLLSHYSKQNDVVFGATASGRNASVKGIEEMVGIFINVLPARVQIRREASLLNWLRELQQKQFEVRDYEYSPLAQVQRWSEVPRGVPLFQSILSFENYPVDDSIRQYTESLEISNVRSTSQTNYPITVIVAPLKRLKVRVVYDRSRFNAAFIRRMQEHFSTLLHNFVVQPEASLNTLAELLVHNESNLLAVQQREARKSSSTRFKKASPKVMNLPQGELVVMNNFNGPNSLPLVVRPAIAELDLIDWAKDNRELIEKRLLRHGALLFRGFQIETASQFEQLAQVICPDLFGEYGDLPREGVGGKVYGSTPYPADKTILFHNESSHMQRWPLKIFFYCLTPPLEGGETPFVDCRRAYQLLDDKLRERLVQKQLMYVRNYIDGLDVSWQSFFHTNERAVVEELCRKTAVDCEWRNGSGLRTRQIRPAVAKHPKTGEMVLFHQMQLHHVSCLEPELRGSLLTMYREDELPRSLYYGDGMPIEDSVIQEIDEVYRQAASSFSWQRGDILLLDNMLTAHGRNPYVGDRKIVVTMGEMIGDVNA